MTNTHIYSTAPGGLGGPSVPVICTLRYKSGAFWADHEVKQNIQLLLTNLWVNQTSDYLPVLLRGTSISFIENPNGR